MTELIDREKRLMEHLQARAALAQPPPDAWGRFITARRDRIERACAAPVAAFEPNEILLVADGGEISEEPETDRELSTRSLILVAVAVVVLLAALVATLGDEAPDVVIDSADIPLSAEPTDGDSVGREPLLERVVAAEAIVDAFNAGRVDDFPVVLDTPQERSAISANSHWTFEGPCRINDADSLVCPMARRDDFFGAAALETRGEWSFLFNDEDQIFLYRHDANDDEILQAAFSRAFESWLRDAHPDEATDFAFAPLGVRSLVPDPNSMTTALEFVDEFVAQSDDYPILDTTGTPPGS